MLWVSQSNFQVFWCILQASLSRSLWSGYHWKDHFLLQNMSIDDPNFGQRWWRQKRNKGQRSSWPFTSGTGQWVKKRNVTTRLQNRTQSSLSRIAAKLAKLLRRSKIEWRLAFISTLKRSINAKNAVVFINICNFIKKKRRFCFVLSWVNSIRTAVLSLFS